MHSPTNLSTIIYRRDVS